MPNQIKAGKKRFVIGLEEKPYMEWRSLLKEMGAPQGTSAQMIDDFIKSQLALVRHLIELKTKGKKITFADALSAIAEMHRAAGVKEEL